MRSQFDNMLEQLHTELVHMGALCEEAISGATKLLFDEKEEREPVHAVEEEIDSLERKIEGLCMKLLLRQQPVAKDLREISSALKMISDMERIGDQAVDIADVAKYINKKQEEKYKKRHVVTYYFGSTAFYFAVFYTELQVQCTHYHRKKNKCQPQRHIYINRIMTEIQKQFQTSHKTYPRW